MIFLDLETTGLQAQRDEIIDFAAIRVNPLTLEIEDELQFFVRPESDLPTFVTYLTGITQDDVAGAAMLHEKKGEIEAFLSTSNIIIGHNVQFDVDFLRAKGIEVSAEIIDTCDLATLALPREKSFALEVLLQRMNIPHDAHRAYGDSVGALELCKQLVSHIQEFPSSFFSKISHGVDAYSRFLQSIPSLPVFEKTRIHYDTIQRDIAPVASHVYSSLEERDAAALYAYNSGKKIAAPKELIQFWSDTRFFPEEDIVFSRNHYADSQAIALYIEAPMSHPPLYAKIIRNQELNIPYTYTDLAIHWNDKEEWRSLTLSESSYEEMMRSRKIMDYTVAQKYTDQSFVWVDISEKTLDKSWKLYMHMHGKLELLPIEKKAQAYRALLLCKTLFFPQSDYYEGKYQSVIISMQHVQSDLFTEIGGLFEDCIDSLDENSNQALRSFSRGVEDGVIKELLLMPDGSISFSATPVSYTHIFVDVPETIVHESLLIDGGSYAKTLFHVDTPLARRIQVPAVYPAQDFPSPKAENYMHSVEQALIELSKTQDKIVTLGGSKRQVEEMALRLQERGEATIILAQSQSGRSKMLYNYQSAKKAILLASWDFLDDRADALEANAACIIKFPFDAPSNPVTKARSKLFANSFESYTIPKTLHSIHRGISKLDISDNVYIYDTVVYAQWAENFRLYFKDISHS